MTARKFKTVEEFLAGGHLKRTDVVLCSSKKSLFSRLIRYGTRSPFCHAAMVFLIPAGDLGFNNTFLIESGTSGVDITDLRHYVDGKSSYQLAIKRLESSWYQSEGEGTDLQRIVRGKMLDYIKAEYDYLSIWRIAKSILRRMVYGLNFMRAKSLRNMLDREMRVPNQFICSGFVQYGYWRAVEDLIERDPSQAGRRDDVDFAGSRTESNVLNAVLATTPEDLARSEKLAWKYVISHGYVWEVDSYEDANRLILGRED